MLLGGLLLAALHTGLWRGLTTSFFTGADPIIDVWTLDWVSSHIVEHPAATIIAPIATPQNHPPVARDRSSRPECKYRFIRTVPRASGQAPIAQRTANYHCNNASALQSLI